MFLAGCSKPQQGSMNDAGYALLYSVTSQQQNVDKLLWIKEPGPDVKAWVEQIAVFNGEVTKELEAWRDAGLVTNLEYLGLPPAEIQARDRAQSRTTGDLLFSEAVSLRMNLIVAQLKALGYCSDLSYAIGEDSSNADVQAKAKAWEERFKELNAQGMAILENAPPPSVAEGTNAATEPHSPAPPRK